MATVKFVILPNHPLKNGTFRIKLAIAHRNTTCYISTHFHVEHVTQFSAGQVVEHPLALTINRKLRTLLDQYEETLYNLHNVDMYSCQQLRSILKHRTRTNTPTFEQVTGEYIAELASQGRLGYVKLLERNMRYFTEYVGQDYPLDQIDEIIIRNFIQHLRTSKELSDTTLNMHLSRTRTIINRAIKMHHVEYRQHPFANIQIQQAPERELDITTAQFIKIRDSMPSCHKLTIARDMFILSYYLGGMNLVDMMQYSFKNTDRIDYTRFKTRNMKQGQKTISFTIQPEAWDIINRHMDKRTGKLDLGYKFSYANLSRYITRNLHRLAEELNIHSPLVFYSARKSFVQHGFDLGIPLEVLEYCIGQSVKSNRPIFNYLRIMRKHADDAIRKILDNLQR